MSDLGSGDALDLLALGASCLGDGGGHTMGPTMRPAWRGARLAGPAFTVTAGMADNLALHVAIAEAPPGVVLVIDASRAPELGYWGEVMTTGAEARGIAGIVIDGGVRDVAAIAEHGFPMFSTHIAHKATVKEGGGGSIGGHVMVSGVEIAPGDWIVGDADGVTVIPIGVLDAVRTAAQAKADNEVRIFAALRDGATTIDLLDLDGSVIERR